MARTSRWCDRAAWLRLADYLAIVVAVTLPWSSSATSIAVVLWVAALVPTLEWATLRRVLLTPAGALPVALFALGALGLLWADVTWVERLGGLDSFVKLLVIPLLFIQFSKTRSGLWPLAGFLVSTAVLLAVSLASVMTPDNLWGIAKAYGVPVKDYIAQAGEFTLAAYAAFYLARETFRRGPDWRLGVGWTMLGCLFLADIFLVITSRTALVTLPLLGLLFVLTQFRGTARIVAVAAVIGACLAAVNFAPMVNERLTNIGSEIDDYQATSRVTSAGERMEFWTKAARMVGEAPLIGHGTGSIRDLYRRAAEGGIGIGAEVAANPHNQTLAVAIQLGVLGAAVLWAMWIAHAFLFYPVAGLPAFVGLIVVTQNVIGSLFNSHLFDFTQGWIYVFGVGVAGGMVLVKPSGAGAKAARRPRRKTRTRRR